MRAGLTRKSRRRSVKRKHSYRGLSKSTSRSRKRRTTRQNTRLRKKVHKGGDSSNIGYVYVPNEVVPSVLDRGYLSMRGQYKYDSIATAAVLSTKYGQQYQSAMDDPKWRESLLAFNHIHGNTGDRVKELLGYLDWRDEATEKGSYAIYFLFAPIPKTLHSEFNRVRDSFLDGRTLMCLKLPNLPVTVVGDVDGRPAEWYASRTSNYWEARIVQALKDGGDDALWLAGVPHGYIVPESGQVEAFLPPFEFQLHETMF